MKAEDDMFCTEDFKAVNVSISEVEMDGGTVLRIQKPSENEKPDDNTYAELKNSDFHNGTLEVQVFSRLKKDAPDYARGFIGIVFRACNTAFESFYVRPTNGIGCTDPIRYVHTVQYFSYPKYTFAYFRENNIKKYESHAEIEMEKWIDLKAEIHEDKADFYVNGIHSLHVDDLKMGNDARGAVGLYVDIGTDGYFRNLKIENED